MMMMMMMIMMMYLHVQTGPAAVFLQCFCSVSVVFLNYKKHVTNEVELTYMYLPRLTYLVPTV